MRDLPRKSCFYEVFPIVTDGELEITLFFVFNCHRNDYGVNCTNQRQGNLKNPLFIIREWGKIYFAISYYAAGWGSDNIAIASSGVSPFFSMDRSKNQNIVGNQHRFLSPWCE